MNKKIPRLGFLLVLLTAGSGFFAFVQAAPAPVKTVVTDVNGKAYPLADVRAKATLLVFVAHDCPISNSYAPEINRIVADYGPRHVRVMVVYAESEFEAGAAREHARGFGFRVPLVLDPTFRLSHAMGATVTPEAALLSPTGQRLYLGRIDDRYVAFGKKRAQATQRDLRAALDAVLDGKTVPHATTTAVGCFIPEETKPSSTR